MQETPPPVIYRIDLNDRFTFFNPTWVSFARDNDAQQLTPDSLTGRLLWDSIDGREVRQLYELILAKVRRLSRPATLPFRCDSPTVRRFMELKIVPATESELQFEALTLKVESRDPVTILNASVPRSDEVLSICSSCKRILSAGNEWLDAEAAITRLGLFDGSPLPQLSHGICPLCRDRIERALERMEDQDSR